jgi:hypothetical protein
MWLSNLIILYLLDGFSATTEADWDAFYGSVQEVLGYLATSGFLIYRGIQLKKLRRQSSLLLRFGLAISLIYTAIGLLSMFLSFVFFAGVPGEWIDAEVPITNAELVGMCFLLVILLFTIATIAFEIYALIWLLQHEDELPLESGPATTQGATP